MANPSVLHKQAFSSGGSNPFNCTLTNQPTVGNVLVVFAWYSSTVSTCTDNQGNTYTKQTNIGNGDVGGMAVFTAPITTASGTFTLTVNSDTSGSGAYVYEISNANNSTLIDGTPGTQSVTGFGTSSIACSLGSAANAGSLALVAFRGNGGFTTTWTSPLVGDQDDGGFDISAFGTVGSTGTFTAQATLSAGESFAVVGIMILPAGPVFSVQPSSQNVPPGQNVTFSVTASGSGTVTYQWFKNGSSITSATSSSYTTPILLASDNQAYFYCVATDSNGSSQSNSAFITITTPLFIVDPTAIIMPLIQISAGAMVGSSAIHITDSGTLKGAGTLSGSSSVHLTTSGVLKENIVGSSTIHLTTSGFTTGKGSLVGSSSIHLTTSGILKENIVGTTTITLTDTGTLKGAGVLAGSSSIHFTAFGTLKENIIGSSTVIITTSTATLNGAGHLTGTSTATLTDAATIHASGSLSTTAQAHITETGTLKGIGSVSGTITVHFTASATGIAKAALVGSSTIHFTASLTANGVVAIHGSSAIAFAGSATIQAHGSLTGTSTESVTTNGTVVGHGRLNGTVPIAINETGTLHATSTCVASSSITVTSAAVLQGTIRCVGASTITVITTGSITAKLAAAGTTSIHFSASATGQLIGALHGTSAIDFIASLRNSTSDSNFVFVVSEETVVITTTIPTIDLSDISVHAEATYVVPTVTPDPVDLDFVTVITEKNAAQ